MTDIKTIHEYRCDLDSGPREVDLPTPLMHQDALADVFQVRVHRGNAPVDLAGMTVYGYLLIASTRKTIPLTGTASGSTASVTLPSECYAQPGHASLVIQLQDGDVRHTVLKVDLCIKRTGSENILYPESASPTLAELLARIDALEKSIGNGDGSGDGGSGGGTGEDGFSPIAHAQQTDEGVLITITDKSGTTTATVHHGKDGAPGTGVVDIKVVEVETQNG